MKMALFLGGIFTVFCLILVVCYGIARESHPIFLDQNGRPTNVATSAK